KPRDPSVAAVKGGKEQPIADVKVAKGTTKRVADRKRNPVSKSAAPASYRVKRGDTLGAIAARHGTTVRVLMDLNRLKRPNPLYVGRKLVLPERSSPSKDVVAR
ncbi:MAG: LysM peptidoglycan-binding domain-containing protein, partial [Syntrophales bacterium]|nr:LysM peptidoglycan-binding domain-containing protein [Syntrophales bacterium]